MKTTQTPATAKNEKCLRMRFFTNFLLRLLRRIRKKNAGSCRLRICGHLCIDQGWGSYLLSRAAKTIGLLQKFNLYLTMRDKEFS